MKLKARISILVVLMIALYTFLICSFISPYALKYILNGPSDEELGIQTFVIASEYQKYQNLIKVLVPDPIDPSRRYPVLYILPVNPGLWDNFWINGIREAAQKDIANKYQIICVYPRYERMPWFGDHPRRPDIRQESHFIHAVIPFVEKNFPVIAKPEGRLLVGFSKSGWAAYSLLLRHPDLFGRAASFDAPLLFDDIYQWASGLREVFDSEENFKGYFLPDLFLGNAEIFKTQKPRFVLLGYAFIKDHTEEMHRFLNELQIPHVYRLEKRSRHTWESGWFEEAVGFLLQ